MDDGSAGVGTDGVAVIFVGGLVGPVACGWDVP